ncbi:hypothetical protein HB162lentus_01040 [Mammaliicoccus lentus]
MNIDLNIVGKIENVTEEIREGLNDLMYVEDVIVMIRTKEECTTVRLRDIADISLTKENVSKTRALQIIK